MPYKTSSWKDKIDPAFPEIIRQYIKFLDITELPSNSGWVVLEDEPMKQWQEKGMRGWIVSYEKDKTEAKKESFVFLKLKNIPVKERNKKINDFKKCLVEKISTLPEESQIYYKKAFTPFLSEKEAIDYFYFKDINRDQLETIWKDFVVNLTFINIHINSIEFEKEFRDSPTISNKKLSRPALIIDLLLSAYESISRLVHEKGFADLLKEAKDGNDESLFKALQIDRTIVECEWIQKKIRKAQLTGDETFFKRMAEVIIKSPLENSKVYGQVAIVLLIFWQLGLYRLTNNELIDLLGEAGIRIQDDPESFRKFVNRLIGSDLKRNIVTFQA